MNTAMYIYNKIENKWYGKEINGFKIITLKI